MTKLSTSMIAVAAAALGTACVSTPPMTSETELCAAAEAHVASCFPDDPSFEPRGCTAEAAADVLARDCQNLADARDQDDAKADGCNIYNPWSWWSCGSSGREQRETEERRREEEQRSAGRTVSVRLSTCYYDVFGGCNPLAEEGRMSCAMVTLTNSRGTEVARTTTNAQGVATFTELTSGNYTVRVVDREDHVVETTEQMPAEATVRVTTTSAAQAAFRFPSNVDAGWCTRLQANVTAECDGDAMAGDDVEWGFAFGLFQGDTRVEEGRAWAQRGGPNELALAWLHPGTYTLRVQPMDPPSSLRRGTADWDSFYRLWVEDEIVEERTIVIDGRTPDVMLEDFALSLARCP